MKASAPNAFAEAAIGAAATGSEERSPRAIRVLHVTPFFAPAWCYGGLVESAYQFSRHLAREGASVRVLTTDANGPGRHLWRAECATFERQKNFGVRYCHRVARQAVAPDLIGAIFANAKSADIIHLHGAYSFPTFPTMIAARTLARPVVWTPHGAFQRWSGSRRTTMKLLWERASRVVGPQRLLIHVTSPAEFSETRSRFPRTRLALIPNGVEIPETLNRSRRSGHLRVGFIGRLDPKKGIENLLRACRLLKNEHRVQYSLSIAGSGDPAYEKHLRAEIEKLGLTAEARLIGTIRDENKTRLLECTDVVVVPSFTENFGIVVAEALAHGTPVIASTGTPWSEVEHRGCGLWVGNDPASLSAAIEAIASMPTVQMGERGRRWMIERFSWGRLAGELLELYGTMIPNAPVLAAAASL
jgi:glycosyltransferase involved in cell wall biosynthesis